MKWIEELDNKEIYIYGTGHYGQVIYQLLEKRGIHVYGAITSDGTGSLYELTVHSYDGIYQQIGKESIIVLAVSEKIQKEILQSKSFNCNVVKLSQEELFIAEKDVYSKYFSVQQDCLTQNKRILVLQIDATFGDLLWNTAFLRELRGNFTDYHISYVINSKFVDLFKDNRYIDDLVGYSVDGLYVDYLNDNQFNRIKSFYLTNFGNNEYEYVFVSRMLPEGWGGNWENIILAMMCNANHKVAHGWYHTDSQKKYTDLISEYFSDVIKNTECIHEVQGDLSMLYAIGKSYESDKMELDLSDDNLEYASDIIEKNNMRIWIAVGLVGSGGEKTWNPENYVKLFQGLMSENNNISFVLCGGPDAKESARCVTDSIKNNVIDLTAKTTLRQAAAIMSMCDLYIGSDTGLMHFASIFGVPIVEICAVMKSAPRYWNGEPHRMGPWRTRGIALQPIKGLDDCIYRCNKNHAHCINQVSVDEVKSSVISLLESDNKWSNSILK